MACSNSPSTRTVNSNHKRLKLSNEVDRISVLPDSVLCFILSFLETREAVQTCILSKRWKFLWTNVPSLDFCRKPSSKKNKKKTSEQFVNMANMAMLLHKAQSLNKFRLVWEDDAVPFNVTAWLSTAIARDVRELHICVFCSARNVHHFIALPGSLFTCKSLEFLELGGDLLVQVPSLVSLPRLECLNLKWVQYESDESVRKLIHGCPVLKSLHIKRKTYDNVIVFTISSPTLRRLKIKAFDDHFESFPTDDVVKLEINAPLLEYLDLSDRLSKDFTIESLISNLVEVHIDVDDPDDSDDPDDPDDLDDLDDPVDPCNWVVKLVKALHCVKILTLGNDTTLEAFSKATADISEKFLSLTKLTVNTPWREWESLLGLLESSVNLEVLEFKGLPYYRAIDETCSRNPNQVPRCLRSSLRKLSISEFCDYGDQLEVIKYILKHGGVLEIIELHPARALDVSTKYRMVKTISAFSRKSTACEIHVLDHLD